MWQTSDGYLLSYLSVKSYINMGRSLNQWEVSLYVYSHYPSIFKHPNID